jgi:hypothetical protein
MSSCSSDGRAKTRLRKAYGAESNLADGHLWARRDLRPTGTIRCRAVGTTPARPRSGYYSHTAGLNPTYSGWSLKSQKDTKLRNRRPNDLDQRLIDDGAMPIPLRTITPSLHHSITPLLHYSIPSPLLALSKLNTPRYLLRTNRTA